MPLMRCQRDNAPGWKWGETGKCYTYDPANRRSENAAIREARKQGRAIEASKARRAVTGKS